MLIADAVPPGAVPIRFGRVPPPGQPEIAEAVELPLFTTGRPLDNELGNAGRIGLAGLPVVGNAGWLARRTATGSGSTWRTASRAWRSTTSSTT